VRKLFRRSKNILNEKMILHVIAVAKIVKALA